MQHIYISAYIAFKGSVWYSDELQQLNCKTGYHHSNPSNSHQTCHIHPCRCVIKDSDAANVSSTCFPLDTLAAISRTSHDDVMKWKLFLHYWPFVWGIHWSPVNSPHKEPVMQTLIFLWCGSAQAVKQTVYWLVIWDHMTFMWHHRNDQWQVNTGLGNGSVPSGKKPSLQ